MKQGKYIVTCPMCGKKLFKGCVANIEEFFCPKCKSNLEVVIERGSVLVKETDFQYETHSDMEG